MFSSFLFILISNEKLCGVQTNANLCLETARVSLLETEISLSILDGLAQLQGLDTAVQGYGSCYSLKFSWLKPRTVEQLTKAHLVPLANRGSTWRFVQPTGSRVIFCYPFEVFGTNATTAQGSWSLRAFTYRIWAFPLEKQKGISSKSRSQLRTNIPIPHRTPSPGLSQSERWDSVPVLATSQMPRISAWV